MDNKLVGIIIVLIMLMIAMGVILAVTTGVLGTTKYAANIANIRVG